MTQIQRNHARANDRGSVAEGIQRRAFRGPGASRWAAVSEHILRGGSLCVPVFKGPSLGRLPEAGGSRRQAPIRPTTAAQRSLPIMTE